MATFTLEQLKALPPKTESKKTFSLSELQQLSKKPIEPAREPEKTEEGATKIPFLGALQRGAIKTGRFLGLEPLGKGIGKALFGLTPEAKKLEEATQKGLVAPETFEEIRTGGLAPREVIGSAIQTATLVGGGALRPLAGKAVVGAGVGAGVKAGIPTGLAKLGITAGITGVVPGAAFGFGRALEEKKEGKELIKPTIIGGLIGGAVATGGEMIRAIREGALAKRPPEVIQRSFNVPDKFLEKDVFNNRKLITEKIIDEGYRGTARQVKIQSEANLSKYGSQIEAIVKKQPNKVVLKENILKEVVEMTKDPFNAQHKTAIEKVLGLIPKRMTPETANNLKQNFYGQVPQSYWNSADPNVAFKGEFMQALGAAFKKEMEVVVPAISTPNAKWSVAHNMRLLATDEIILTGKLGIVGRSGIFAFLQNILDRTLRAPAVSTRTAPFQRFLYTDLANRMKNFTPLQRVILIDALTNLGKSE